jgi:hypothetical protein
MTARFRTRSSDSTGRVYRVYTPFVLPLLALPTLAFAEEGAPAPVEHAEDPLPLPDWEPRPPGGPYAVGVGINRAGVWSLAGAAGGGLTGVTMMASSGVAGYGFYQVGTVLAVASSAPALLATPAAAIGPLVSCQALRRAGVPASCAAGTVAVALLGVASASFVVALTEPDLEGAPAFVSLATVPAIWVASGVQVSVNKRGLKLVTPRPYSDSR